MATQLSIDFDITARKHHGNAASRAAHESVKQHKADTSAEIISLLQRGPMTGKEIAHAMGRELHCISGRLSELIAAKKIERTGERREGSAVLRIRQ